MEFLGTEKATGKKERIRWHVNRDADVSKLSSAASAVYDVLCRLMDGDAQVEKPDLDTDGYNDAMAELAISGMIDILSVSREQPKMPGQREATFKIDAQATERFARKIAGFRQQRGTLTETLAALIKKEGERV